MDLLPPLQGFVETIKTSQIPEDRKKTLNPLIAYAQRKRSAGLEIRLNFICTHNSRRSHLSQIWAQTMAYYFGVINVSCYSGGTEATALFPAIAQTLENTGFQIQRLSEEQNPVYTIKYAPNQHPVIGFSKKMDHAFNPQSKFGAIMTCDSANEACPLVPGAEVRIPITYDDPKLFDHTPQQLKKYQERSYQIASEMYYVFSQIYI